MSSSDEILHLNKMNYRNYTFNVCNEIILTVPVVFYLKKNSYLKEIIDEKIDDFRSSGLIDHWISKYLDPKYLHVTKPYLGPTKLNFIELLGAFQLLAFGLICSVFAFGFESILHLIYKRVAAFVNSFLM